LVSALGKEKVGSEFGDVYAIFSLGVGGETVQEEKKRGITCLQDEGAYHRISVKKFT